MLSCSSGRVFFSGEWEYIQHSEAGPHCQTDTKKNKNCIIFRKIVYPNHKTSLAVAEKVQKSLKIRRHI
jgi:hypothetical protein